MKMNDTPMTRSQLLQASLFGIHNLDQLKAALAAAVEDKVITDVEMVDTIIVLEKMMGF